MAVEWSKALRNGWDYGFEPRPLSKRSYFASSMFNVFFQGTNADQDNRFSDKEKKLLKQMKFEEVLSKKVRKKVKAPIFLNSTSKDACREF